MFQNALLSVWYFFRNNGIVLDFFFVPVKERSFPRFLHNQNLQLLWFQKLNFWAANQLETRETHNILRNKTVSCLWGWRGGGERGLRPWSETYFWISGVFQTPPGAEPPPPVKNSLDPPGQIPDYAPALIYCLIFPNLCFEAIKNQSEDICWINGLVGSQAPSLLVRY